MSAFKHGDRIEADQYKERLSATILKAIFETSTIEGTDGRRVCALMTGEISAVLVQLMAFMLASSPSASSPTRLRQYCDDAAKRLYRATRAAQDAGAINVFDQVYVAPDKMS